MKKIFLTQWVLMLVGVAVAVFFFADTRYAFALSYSPSTIYPGTPYTISEFVSNSTSASISVTKDCFWWKNGSYGGTWGHAALTIPPGGGTATCSSTGDVAGTQMSFQMNIWRPNYSGTVTWSTTNFTVQSPPVSVYSLTTSVSSGSGSVSCNGGSCASSYQSGTALTLAASPSSGYTFSGWGGVCSGTGSCSLTMNGNKSVSASFSAIPVNALSVQTTLDGGPYSLTINQAGGSPSGMGGTTSSGNPSYYTRSTTANIDATLRAPSVSGNYFSGWSGCSSVSGTDCRIIASGGQSVSVRASYLSPSAQPNLQVGISLKGATKKDGGWLASGPGQTTTLYLIATASNGGGGPAYEPFDVSLSLVRDEDGLSYGGGGTINGLPNGASKKVSVGHALGSGTWTLRACVDSGNAVVESNEGDNCISQKIILSYETPPSPIPSCFARFINTITDVEGNWQVNVNGGIEGCPGDRYRFLRVSGSADNDIPLGKDAIQTVFDTLLGRNRSFGREVQGCSDENTMGTGDLNAIPGSAGAYPPCGSTTVSSNLHFVKGDPNWNANERYLTSGSFFSALYTNASSAAQPALFRLPYLPWGNYPFRITNTFSGEYACTLGGTQTNYYEACDRDNVAYNLAQCDPNGNPSRLPETTTAVAPDWRSFAEGNLQYPPVQTQLTLCALEGPNRLQGGETSYYDMQCVPHNPDRAEVKIECGSGESPPTNPPYVATPGIVLNPVTPPLPPPQQPPSFTHRLTVESKKDNISAPGVKVTQVLPVPPLPAPIGGARINPPPETPLPNSDFGGTTDYYKLADRNFKITLEAEPTHPSGGTFSSWKLATPSDRNGCDVVFNRQCEIQFAFGTAGGESRTITANYTGKLDAPVITTSAASCDANGGKVNITLQSAVSGATGYRLYRSTSSGFTAGGSAQAAVALSSANLIKTFTSANAPVAGTPNAPFVDSGLAAGTNYYYKMEAYNSSVTSAASAEASRAASLPCPDLVVDATTGVQIIEASTGAVITDTTKVPANTSIKFRAKIRNQNGAIVPSSTSFNNQFFLDGNTTNSFATQSTIPLTGTQVSPLSDFIVSFPAPTLSTGSYSLQVCADVPILGGGKIKEANTTGNAEDNNCLPTGFSFSVINPITVELECEKAGGVYDRNYCVIDYAQASKLKWVTSGSPTSCNWVAGSDLTGTAANQNPTVNGNPFSLSNLLSKLRFSYQLECTR